MRGKEIALNKSLPVTNESEKLNAVFLRVMQDFRDFAFRPGVRGGRPFEEALNCSQRLLSDFGRWRPASRRQNYLIGLSNIGVDAGNRTRPKEHNDKQQKEYRLRSRVALINVAPRWIQRP